MEPEVPEAKKTITMSWALLGYIVVGVTMLVSVYWRFVVVEKENIEQDARIEYVNERIDKKHKQQQGDIKALEDRIKELEQPNTDK
jgi:formate-dependent nitrite reductase membrane component NrfD